MSCPFYISDDFAKVSRIVDIGGVTEIVLECVFAKRLHFASKMDILKNKGGDCYGANIKCICTSGA